jgi:hypothetical protein
MKDGLPPMKPGDRVPNKIKQAKLVEILGEPASAVSIAVKTLREHQLARPAAEDGGLYTEHSVMEGLFASQRENPAVSPLDSSNDPRSEDPLLEWKAFEKYWFDANPDAAAQVRALEAERAELRLQVKERAEDIEEIRRRPLKAWQRYQRSAGSNSWNGTVHEVQNGSGHAAPPPEAPPVGSAEQNVQDSTLPEEVKSRAVNETADLIFNRETVPSSSSGCNATESATTTTVDAPVSHQEGSAKPTPTTAVANEDTPSKAGISDVEFHQELSVAFRDARKNVPTPSQSAACYAAVGRHATEFLSWLAGGPDHPPKLPSVRHPGVLLSLVEEFESWTCAEPPPAPPAPPRDPAEDEERPLMVEYAEFCEAEAFRLFAAIPDLVLRGLIDEKHKFLRREGRLDRMSLDARRCEATNLILQDIEREQVMPFAEWVELKRKGETSP